MKTNQVLMTALIAIAVLAGCKKEESGGVVVPAANPDQSVLGQLFTNNVANARQYFTVNAASGGQVIGTKGTKLNFGPGTFLLADGTPVTGQVDVSLVEVLSIGDMIWLNKQTVGNDNGTLKLLRSGGAINVSAAQSGSPLRITQGGLVVRIPTDVGDAAMMLFSGNETTSGSMIWNPIDSSSVTVDPGYIDPSYYFTADSLQWINCDYFYSYPSTTDLTSTIPAGQSTDSTQVWVAFPSENAVMQMNHTTAQSYSSWQVVPVGMQAVVIGLQQSSGGYNSSFTTVTISASMNVPMVFAPTTLAQFQANVNAL